jgi:hypothetical protein
MGGQNGERVIRYGRGEVDVAPLRDAFLQLDPAPRPGRGGSVPKDAAVVVAARLGWVDRGRADGVRVRRVLGLRPYHSRSSRSPWHQRRLRETVTREMAVRVCEAMGYDPVDFGL